MLELKQKLVDMCNQSGLPFEAIYFVIKDLWRDAEDTLRSAKDAEIAASKEENEQKEEEE